MRNRYLVCYDVADPRRLARIYKRMHGFGQPVQYSVFICDLSPKERVLLQATLTQTLNFTEDRVLILDAGPSDGRGQSCMTSIGKSAALPTRGPVVV